jgi:hypothetical protein
MVRRTAVKKISYLLALALLPAVILSAQDYPRVETFLGYTYFRANSATDIPAFSANGGGGQLAVNFNRHIGFVMDIGAVHNGNINNHELDGTFVNYLWGPRVSFRHGRVTPYLNILFGGIRASESIGVIVPEPPTVSNPIYLPGTNVPAEPGNPVGLRAVHSQTAFAMTVGGGIDIKINRHLSFRPIGLDYMLTRLQNIQDLQDRNQNNLRYTTGFDFTFGGEAPAPPPPPPPPAMKACWDGSSVPVSSTCPLKNIELNLTAAQTELCPGGNVTVQFPGAPATAVYQWTVNNEPVSKDKTFDFGASGRDPGPYKISLKVTAPDYNDANASTTITVRSYSPPTGTVDASPREILAGEKATLSANFSPGQCGGNVGAPTFTASDGRVSGNTFDSAEIAWDPAATSDQRKTVTIAAKASDGKGEGQAQTTLVVKKPAMARRLPDIVFPTANARVNNCGKRVLLEELKAALETDPNGKVVLVGHVSPAEASKAGLDQQRALNAAAVISAGQGVCYGFQASQIMVGAVGAADNGVDYQSHFCGSSTQELPGSTVRESESDAKLRRVEVWFVPSGSALPASVANFKDAASLSVSTLGCPK